MQKLSLQLKQNQKNKKKTIHTETYKIYKYVRAYIHKK